MNNTITLAEVLNPVLTEDAKMLCDNNGVFDVKYDENGCHININTGEDCTPIVLSAISKYAERHGSFNMEQVTLQPRFSREAEDERWDYQSKFTVVSTSDGCKMIWNKDENKAYKFSFISDEIFSERTDVIDMKYCVFIAPCIYAFCLEEESEDAVIGIVDVYTGKVIPPKYTDIYSLSHGKFVGVRDSEFGCCWSMINVFPVLEEETIADVPLRYYANRNYCCNEKLDGYIFGFNEAYSIKLFSHKEDSCYSFCEGDGSLHLKCVDQLRYSGLCWINRLEITFEDGQIADLIFRGFSPNLRLSLRDNKLRYYLGENQYEYVKPFSYQPGLYLVKIGCKYAISDCEYQLTPADFTSEMSLIGNRDDCLISAEIYGKRGVLRLKREADGSGYTTVLPFEFSSVVYYITKIKVEIKDDYGNTVISAEVGNGAFLVKKAGMCAVYSYYGVQETPFVKEELMKIDIVHDVTEWNTSDWDTSDWGTSD